MNALSKIIKKALPTVVSIVISKKLEELENQTHATIAVNPQQTELFPEEQHPILMELDKLNPDSLTPKQALDILYQLIHLRRNS